MANQGHRSDLSTSDYLKAAQRYPWLVALPILVLGLLAWFLLGRGSAQFSAKADVLVRASQAQEDFDRSGSRQDPNFLANEVRFAESDVVRDEVASRLGIEPFVKLIDIHVEITASDSSEVLTFTAIEGSADGAATKANAYAESYVDKRRETAVDSYTSAIDLLNTQLGEIRSNRAEVRADLDSAILELTGMDEGTARFDRQQATIDRLQVELAPQLEAFNTQESTLIAQQSDLKLLQNLARTGIASVTNSAFAPKESLPNAGIRGFIIAELIGLVLGLILAVTVYKMDDRLRDASDVEAAFPDLTVLGTLPYQSSVRKQRSITVLAEPGSPYSEAIYQIRTSLRFMMLESGVRLVVVTSAQPSEGKTTFSANFAWSLAGPDDPVVLIDGDLRRPVGHEHFGVELAPGLTDMVLYNRQLDSVVSRFDEQDPGFSFLPAGMYSGNPADFMGSTPLVKQIRTIADDALTVVDAAPVLPVSDARAVAGASDLTILVVRLEEAHRKDVAAAIANLTNAGTTNLALVLVGGRVKAAGYYGNSGDPKGANRASGTPTVAPLSNRSRLPKPEEAAPIPESPAPRPAPVSTDKPRPGQGRSKKAKPEKKRPASPPRRSGPAADAAPTTPPVKEPSRAPVTGRKGTGRTGRPTDPVRSRPKRQG